MSNAKQKRKWMAPGCQRLDGMIGDTLVLALLIRSRQRDAAMTGYEILKYLQKKGFGMGASGAATYPRLKRLDRLGLIKSLHQKGKRDIPYIITNKGVMHYQRNKQLWRDFRTKVDSILS